MKSKVLLFFLVSIATLMTGCSSSKVNIESGNGLMMYEGVKYPLNLSTAATYPVDGGYKHTVTFTNTKNGNTVFTILVKDDNSQTGISAGSYPTSLNGDYTAHFSVEGTGDYLLGTIEVTMSGDTYTFNFTGTTIDENTPTMTVTFTYTGKIVKA